MANVNYFIQLVPFFQNGVENEPIFHAAPLILNDFNMRHFNIRVTVAPQVAPQMTTLPARVSHIRKL